MRNLLYLIVCSCILCCYSCNNDASDLNQRFIAVEKLLSSGEITDFATAKSKLEEVMLECKSRLAEIEFNTDETSIRETANIKTVIGRIDDKIRSLNNEEQTFSSLSETNSQPYENIKQLAQFLQDYPQGLKYTTIKERYQTQMSSLIDGMSETLHSQLTQVNEDNTNDNLYQTVSYVKQTTGTTMQDSVDMGDFETAMQHFSDVKESMIQTVSAPHIDVITPNGNSISSLKDQFDAYENKLKEKRAKAEAYIRELVSLAVVSQGWDSQARTEIEAYILRARGGFWSTCDERYLSNTITQADENKVSLLSDKVKITMHYNVSSYCGNNANYKYYDAIFTLIFPIIRKQLGDGYFENKNITQTN